MRYSTNLNIILRAISAATNHISRDFIELENLQNNSVSAQKFANACCQKIKKILFQEFSKFRPDYDILFCDGEVVRRKNDSESQYRLIVNYIDGFENLSRSNPDFTVSIALQYRDKGPEFGNVAAVIYKPIGNEMVYAEKGFGCFFNNRRLRMAERKNLGKNGTILVSAKDLKSLPKNSENYEFQMRFYGCQTLEIAYLVASKIDRIYLVKNEALLQSQKTEIYSDWQFIAPFFMMIIEAGGQISVSKKEEISSDQEIVILGK